MLLSILSTRITVALCYSC